MYVEHLAKQAIAAQGRIAFFSINIHRTLRLRLNLIALPLMETYVFDEDPLRITFALGQQSS